MRPIKISLVSLGNLKYPVSISHLEIWPSKVLTIQHGASVGHLPNSDGGSWVYTDEHLLEVLKADEDSDFTVGLINVPLEGNYYMRRLTDKVAVLSLYEMADIVLYSEFTLEQFILRNIYELTVLFAANGKLIPTDYTTWAHDEVRGCIFDMNSSKSDIVFSLHRPILCPSCKTRVSSKQLPAEFVPTLERELLQIKKSLFVRMTEWVKVHPIFALLITATFGVVLNLIASVIFEKAKHVLPWLG